MSIVEEHVIDKIRTRAEQGLKKYGMTVANNPLSVSEWLNHAQEEALDFSIYLQKLKELEVVSKEELLIILAAQRELCARMYAESVPTANTNVFENIKNTRIPDIQQILHNIAEKRAGTP